MNTRLVLCALFVLTLTASGAAQQPPTDPVSEAPIRLGVLGLAPRVVLTDVGVDTNVFNQVDDQKRDFTFTVTPGLNFWLRTKRGLLSFGGRSDLAYYQTYDSERSINGSGQVQYEYRFNRIRPFVEFSALNTRQRQGQEIDARVRRFDNALETGIDVRVASKSFVEVRGRREKTRYAADAVFEGQPLNVPLNRTLEAVDLTWRQRLTALTTWVVRMSGERERFELQESRNSDGARAAMGLELGRFALVRGAAFVGYRRLVGVEGGTIPEFSGVTCDVNVSYTAPTQTRLAAIVARDVEYSYQTDTPYYVQTGWTATLTQRITGRWDLQLLGGRDRLAYRSDGAAVGDERRARVDRVGGGIGYQLNDELRVSFDILSQQRQAGISGRDYKALRAGMSVTYAF